MNDYQRWRLLDFEIVRCDKCYPDYFNGFGSSYTKFKSSVVGAGLNAVEAYNDALEQIQEQITGKKQFPKRPRGINKKDRASSREPECYVYVGIRYSLEEA